MSSDNPTILQPLSLWEKTVAGVKGFFKTLAKFIPQLPKAAVLTGAFLLGGAFIKEFTPFDPLGTGGLVGLTAPMVLSRIGISLLIGGIISGGVGAFESITQAEKEHCACAQDPAKQARHERAHALQQQRDIASPGAPAGQMHLPQGKPANKMQSNVIP